MEYFLFVVFFSFFVLLSIVEKEKVEGRGIYYILAFFVALLVGLRGIEDEYTRLFIRVPELTGFFRGVNEIAVEKGYLFALICSTLKSLGFNSQALLFVFAF